MNVQMNESRIKRGKYELNNNKKNNKKTTIIN